MSDFCDNCGAYLNQLDSYYKQPRCRACRHMREMALAQRVYARCMPAKRKPERCPWDEFKPARDVA